MKMVEKIQKTKNDRRNYRNFHKFNSLKAIKKPCKKQIYKALEFSGPTWARTKDPLIMSQML